MISSSLKNRLRSRACVATFKFQNALDLKKRLRSRTRESDPYRHLVFRGQKVEILIRRSSRKRCIFWTLTSYMNINRITCRHTIRIIRSCWNAFRSTYRNTFRIACRITCRINSLETHFEIYSPSIGVCKNISISRNKHTNQSQPNKTKQTKQGYAMRYGNVQRPRPTSNRRDRCYGAESLMFVRVSQRRDRPTKALQ